MEGNQENGAIPFLDYLVTSQAENSLSITVYCKTTPTDEYLQWDNHPNLSTKYSVIGPLTNRIKTVCTRPELFQKELQHLREALVKFKYPQWAINRIQSKYINNWEDNINTNNLQDNHSTPTLAGINLFQAGIATTHKTPTTQTQVQKKSPNMAKTQHRICGQPYMQGMAESFTKICGKYGIQTYFKGYTTVKQIIMKPKTRTLRIGRVG